MKAMWPYHLGRLIILLMFQIKPHTLSYYIRTHEGPDTGHGHGRLDDADPSQKKVTAMRSPDDVVVQVSTSVRILAHVYNIMYNKYFCCTTGKVHIIMFSWHCIIG